MTLQQALQAVPQNEPMQIVGGSKKPLRSSSLSHMAAGCCAAWCRGREVESVKHADIQQDDAAQRISLLIAKAAQYTNDYKQVSVKNQLVWFMQLLLH